MKKIFLSGIWLLLLPLLAQLITARINLFFFSRLSLTRGNSSEDLMWYYLQKDIISGLVALLALVFILGVVIYFSNLNYHYAFSSSWISSILFGSLVWKLLILLIYSNFSLEKNILIQKWIDLSDYFNDTSMNYGSSIFGVFIGLIALGIIHFRLSFFTKQQAD